MSQLPTKIEYEERKIGDMPIGRTRFDTIEEKINAIIAYLSDQGEEKEVIYHGQGGYKFKKGEWVYPNGKFPILDGAPVEKKCCEKCFHNTKFIATCTNENCPCHTPGESECCDSCTVGNPCDKHANNQTYSPCHTPVESEWEKEFEKEFWKGLYGKDHSLHVNLYRNHLDNIKSFISSLLLTAKAEERKRIEGIIQKMIDDSYKSSPMNPVQLSDILTAIK